jgi:hypothetical protein
MLQPSIPPMKSANEAIFITYRDNPEADLYFRNTRMTSRGAKLLFERE